jgi:hypothetical protein
MDLRGAKADAVSFWQVVEDPRASIPVPAKMVLHALDSG